MMLSKCCTQYVNKSGRPSGHSTGKVQSSSQFPRRVVLKNVQIIGQLHSSPKLVKKKQVLSRVRLCSSMDCSPPGSSVHGIFPGKNTRVGCHFLLQGIFLTQGSKPGLLHSRQTLPSKPPGNP